MLNLDLRGNGMAYYDVSHDDDSNLEYVDDEPAPFVSLMFEVMQPGSYIGLRSPPTSLKLCFAVKVISKDVALEYIIESSGHGILANENYVTGT